VKPQIFSRATLALPPGGSSKDKVRHDKQSLPIHQ
jgi:hypothetical protein